MNPFIIRGYEGKRFFCDRAEESARIVNALRNKRDITLVSLRKMGKTGLIYYVFELLAKEKQVETIYLDIYHTENLNQLINQLATALFRMKKPFGQRMKEFILNFRYVRPVISLDSLTGLPSVSFQIAGEQEAGHTLEDLFALIAERSKKTPVVLAIDEFQQISQYPERNVEALIRGITIKIKNVRFIFSGSNKAMLSRMFGDATRPFYQSTEMLFLEEIGQPVYKEFISRKFTEGSRRADDETISEILRLTRCHTWYAQYFCNRLFETGEKDVRKIYPEIFRSILIDNEAFYFEIRTLLTRYQWQLLKGIACSDGAGAVTSGDFIRSYNLSNASTVKRGIDSLLEKELIYRRNDLYFVYDVFFSRWLETQRI